METRPWQIQTVRWDDEKEREYLEQLKETYMADTDTEDLDKEEIYGVFIPSKLLKEESTRSCPVCSTYSFKSNDDVYMTKFECCQRCYFQWIEGREERWMSGWRTQEMKITSGHIEKHYSRRVGKYFN